MIRPFRGVSPLIAPTAFVDESARVIGDVHIGAHSSVWFHAVVRGDVNYIRIGESTNIQDGSVLHVTSELSPLIIGDRVTAGHNVILHGCTIKDGALIGMGAIVLDKAIIGEQALIAAGSVVGMNQEIPPRTLAAGVPAKVKRELTDQDLMGLVEGWRHYVQLKEEYLRDIRRPDKS